MSRAIRSKSRSKISFTARENALLIHILTEEPLSEIENPTPALQSILSGYDQSVESHKVMGKHLSYHRLQLLKKLKVPIKRMFKASRLELDPLTGEVDMGKALDQELLHEFFFVREVKNKFLLAELVRKGEVFVLRLEQFQKWMARECLATDDSLPGQPMTELRKEAKDFEENLTFGELINLTCVQYDKEDLKNKPVVTEENLGEINEAAASARYWMETHMRKVRNARYLAEENVWKTCARWVNTANRRSSGYIRKIEENVKKLNPNEQKDLLAPMKSFLAELKNLETRANDMKAKYQELGVSSEAKRVGEDAVVDRFRAEMRAHEIDFHRFLKKHVSLYPTLHRGDWYDEEEAIVDAVVDEKAFESGGIRVKPFFEEIDDYAEPFKDDSWMNGIRMDTKEMWDFFEYFAYVKRGELAKRFQRIGVWKVEALKKAAGIVENGGRGGEIDATGGREDNRGNESGLDAGGEGAPEEEEGVISGAIPKKRRTGAASKTSTSKSRAKASEASSAARSSPSHPRRSLRLSARKAAFVPTLHSLP